MPYYPQLLIAAIAFALVSSQILWAQESTDSLPTLNIPSEGHDDETLFRVLHGATILAESGAGYEGARILAALATQAKHLRPGQEASDLLRELGVSVDDIRNANRKEIDAKLAAWTNQHHHDDEHHDHDLRQIHVRNLVELKQFNVAAEYLLNSNKGKTPGQVSDGAMYCTVSGYRLRC